jgi:pimeloyl-ACP methyl ester carboxylesterase
MSNARDSRDVLNDPPPPAADERIVYGPEPLQFADLRWPSGAPPHPLVIIIHGGAWKSIFNLIHAGHMAIALRDLGYATFSIEYRRVGDPGGGWPGTFEDVLLAVRHALQLPDVDRDRAVIAGHSAGGHLALLAASETKLPVIPLAASSDLEAHENAASLAFLSGSAPADASPRRRIPLGVRQIFIHGTDDDQVPYSLSTAFVDAARGVGDDAVLITLEGANHFEMIDPQSGDWPLTVEAVPSLIG